MDIKTPDRQNSVASEDQNQSNAPLAIVGMSCRMPNGANSPDEYWSLLEQGGAEVSSLEQHRFVWPSYVDVERTHPGIDRAYLVDHVDSFDAEFFGISAKEAEMMDPQQRMLMELSWEAFESAGIKPSSVSGSATGVFVGFTHSDYVEVVSHNLDSPETFIGTGNVSCILANRISFFYGLKGPSIAVDTACSSSLFALSEAIHAIEQGQCEQALVGAVNLILASTFGVSYHQAGMTSRNGYCRPFDESSDGYLRGEGGGMLLVKRLGDAERNGDNILAVVKGCGVNHGGHGKTITSPNPRAQSNAINAAMDSANITPDAINYIETHGTGTPVGDPIEFQGMLRSFKQSAKKSELNLKDNYCALGAVKACIGHLEPSAGIASMIKVILALQHRKLPANKRFDVLNKRINTDLTPFYIVQHEQEWLPVLDENNKPQPLCAGISSFGFGGTNAHVILQEYKTNSALPSDMGNHDLGSADVGNYIFVDTARSEDQLAQHIGKLLSMSDFDQLDSADLSYSMVTGREFFAHRIACVFRDQAHLRELLTGWLLDRRSTEIFAGVVDVNKQVDDNHASQSNLESVETLERSIVSDKRVFQLNEFAAQFVKGVDVPFEKLLEGNCKRIPIPTYAFDRKRYWIKNQFPGNSNKHLTAYSKLHSEIRKQENNEHTHGITFTGGECFFRDHRYWDNSIFPGVAFLELARSVCQKQSLLSDSARFGALEFRNIAWVAPLIANGETDLFININHQHDGVVEFQFYATALVNESNLLCRGNVKLLDHRKAELRSLNLNELFNSSDFELYSAQRCYHEYASLGMQYGESHMALQKIYFDQDKSIVLAEAKIPACARAEFDQLVLHPSMLDAALQATIGFNLGGEESVLETINLPFGLSKLSYYRPLTNSCWVEASGFKSSSSGMSVHCDITIFDELGRLCISMESLELRKAPKEFSLLQQRGFLENDLTTKTLVPDWQAVDLTQPISTSRAVSSTKMSYEDNQLFRKTIVIGADAVELQQFNEIRNNVTGLSLELGASTNDIQKALEPYSDADELVMVFGESGVITTAICETLVARQFEATRFFLSFAKALASIAWKSKAPTLVLVTRQSVRRIGSFANEFANWRVKLVDVEHEQSLDVKEILDLPFLESGNVLQMTKGAWYQQILVSQSIVDKQKANHKQEGVYLIIGGAGGLGELYTEHLIKQYKAKVIWLGRRKITEGIREKIKRLAALGVAPVYLQGDASDYSEMQKIRQNIMDQFGGVDGIVHSAMVLDDAMMINMSEDSLSRVAQSKVSTGVNIGRVFLTDDLDFILFFSSINSYSKASGQSNYVSGCAFTDALAHQMRLASPTTVKVVNWGFWGTLGAVAQSKYRKRMEKLGYASIEPNKAMTFLDVFMNSDINDVSYVAVVSDKLPLGLPVVGERVNNVIPLLPEITSLIHGDKLETVNSLRTYLLGHVAELLDLQVEELDTEQVPFEDVVLSNYGLDSLLASNIRYQVLKDTDVDLPIQLFIGDAVSTIIEEFYQQLLLIYISTDHEQEGEEEFEQFVF